MQDLRSEHERLGKMLRQLPSGYEAVEFISTYEGGPDPDQPPIKLYLAAGARLLPKLRAAKLSLTHSVNGRWGTWKEALRSYFGTDTMDIDAWGPIPDEGGLHQEWRSLKDALNLWR